MMNDLISRQAAIDALTHEWDGMVTSVFDVVKSLPSAQPERKTGRWVEMGQNKDGSHNLCCGVCGKFKFKSKGHANSQYTKERYKFCGGCGAKMEVEHERSNQQTGGD